MKKMLFKDFDKVDKFGIIHAGIGKVSFKENDGDIKL